MIAFVQSLGVIGYLVLGIVVLCLWNVRKLFKLRSPLDSQQHKIWRNTGGGTPPDHLPQDKDT